MKIKRFFKYSIFALSLAVGTPMMTGCEELSDTLSNISDNETVAALKEALGVGVKTAVNKLSTEGYAAEIATKIGLPEGAQTAFTAYNALMKTSAGKAVAESCGLGDGLEDNLIQAFNDAATDAAPKSAQIFADEITGLSIQDGKDILFGGEGAATRKLQNDTQEPLMAAFHPTITNSMNNVKVAGFTATELWSKFASANNALADKLNTTGGQIAITAVEASGQLTNQQITAIKSIQSVNPDVSDFITERALNGLFLKIAEKENGIRSNVAERSSDLLKRVFGQLDK